MRLKSISFWGVLCFLLLTACTAEPLKEIRSGEIWPDNQGVHVNAHGGGILYHDGTYYWYGENKSDSTSSAMVGIMCYSSKNLTDWNNEGAVLPVVLNDSTSDIVKDEEVCDVVPSGIERKRLCCSPFSGGRLRFSYRTVQVYSFGTY